jgi:DNA modification methylase
MDPVKLHLPLGDNPPSATLYYGQDVIESLRQLPDGCVHTICTSPPYYGLRDYGATGQLGMEDTPEEFVTRLVGIFRELRRVLRDDGTCWLNLGDTYSRGDRGNVPTQRGELANEQDEARYDFTSPAAKMGSHGTIKPKDLIGIPWRVAFALQADGWYLRQDLIWAKPNCMPESVRDRCTKSHEYVFLLTKQNRYFYDHDAIKEPHKHNRWGKTITVDASVLDAQYEGKAGSSSLLREGADNFHPEGGKNKRSVWWVSPKPYPDAHFAVWPPELVEPMVRAGSSERGCCPGCGAPWERVTEGWRPTCGCNKEGLEMVAGALEFIESPTGERAGDDPTLTTGRAGMNRPRGDNEGVRQITRYEQRQYSNQLVHSPYQQEMITEVGRTTFAHYVRIDLAGARPIPEAKLQEWIGRGWLEQVVVPSVTPLDPVRCTVLDPFSGSGTTGMVALREDRNYIGIDINPDYLPLAQKRVTGQADIPEPTAEDGTILGLLMDEE